MELSETSALPRFSFTAEVEADMPVGHMVKVAGRVDGYVHKAEMNPKPGLYAPPPGYSVVMLSPNPPGESVRVLLAFCVESPEAVIADVKALRG